jgi:MFS family permease
MAMFGMGVMLGPILGPSLGAYLTEYYNWRWVFFINVPLGAWLFGIRPVKDPERDRDGRSISPDLRCSRAIGAMQLMDRAIHQLWFQSTGRHRGRSSSTCLYVLHILTRLPSSGGIQGPQLRRHYFSGTSRAQHARDDGVAAANCLLGYR